MQDTYIYIYIYIYMQHIYRYLLLQNCSYRDVCYSSVYRCLADFYRYLACDYRYLVCIDLFRYRYLAHVYRYLVFLDILVVLASLSGLRMTNCLREISAKNSCKSPVPIQAIPLNTPKADQPLRPDGGRVHFQVSLNNQYFVA